MYGTHLFLLRRGLMLMDSDSRTGLHDGSRSMGPTVDEADNNPLAFGGESFARTAVGGFDAPLAMHIGDVPEHTFKKRQLLADIPVLPVENYTEFLAALPSFYASWLASKNGTTGASADNMTETAFDASLYAFLPEQPNITIRENTDILAGKLDPGLFGKSLKTDQAVEANYYFLQFTLVSGGGKFFEQNIQPTLGLNDRSADIRDLRFIDFDLDRREVGGWLTFNVSLEGLGVDGAEWITVYRLANDSIAEVLGSLHFWFIEGKLSGGSILLKCFVLRRTCWEGGASVGYC